jgi:hypothetical protein
LGGSFQKLVCNDITICGGEHAIVPWEEKGGKETIRNTFCRKWQAAQNAMKLMFRGRLIKCHAMNCRLWRSVDCVVTVLLTKKCSYCDFDRMDGGYSKEKRS